jgi:two-component system phosphate regulon sensor histidine kinase PhoR
MAQDRIITFPTIANGRPVIRDTQIPVYEVLACLATSKNLEEVLHKLPGLELADVKAALEYAATVVRQYSPPQIEPPSPMDELAPGQGPAELDLKKILVVDDTEANRLLIQAILRNSGFTLSMATDGAEGLAKARAELPFLIISDIQMPGLSGLQFLLKLKADERTKNAGVILVTADRRDSQQVSQGLALGADDYITVPFKRDEFLARVGTVVRIKWAEAEARCQARVVEQRNQGLELVNELALAVNSSLDLQEIFASSMQKLSQLLDAEAVSLLLFNEASQELVVDVASRTGEGISTAVDFQLEAAPQVIEEEVPLILSNILADLHDNLGLKFPPAAGVINCIPMMSKEQIIGAIAIVNKRGGDFDATESMLLDSAAGIVAVAVENARLFGEVQDFSRHLERMVTERTRELAEEKEKTEAILASMADGLLVLDAEKRVLTANTVAESMLDFCLSEWQGNSIEPEQLENPLWLRISQMTDSTKPTVSASVDVPAAQTGGMLSLQAHAAKVRDEAGQVIGTVIVLRDITAIKQVEQMKARFMAGVTHELKTPLSVIRLHAKNLLTYHARLPEPKRNELLDSIQTQVKLLEKLVENILELSRLDAGTLKIERQPHNLVTLIGQVVADLYPLAEEKQIRLGWQEPAEEMTVFVDADQIERVVRNLVENAIKYTPTGGAVDVQTLSELKEGRLFVHIRVADTGMGIPPEHQARVFDRFYRVDPSHTIPGTGLGLSIVKEIVKAHGGEVQFESTPGEGSTFVVTLPA